MRPAVVLVVRLPETVDPQLARPAPPRGDGLAADDVPAAPLPTGDDRGVGELRGPLDVDGTDGDGEDDLDGDGDGEGEDDPDGEGEVDGVGEADGEGEVDGEGEGVGLGEWLGPWDAGGVAEVTGHADVGDGLRVDGLAGLEGAVVVVVVAACASASVRAASADASCVRALLSSTVASSWPALTCWPTCTCTVVTVASVRPNARSIVAFAATVPVALIRSVTVVRLTDAVW